MNSPRRRTAVLGLLLALAFASVGGWLLLAPGEERAPTPASAATPAGDPATPTSPVTLGDAPAAPPTPPTPPAQSSAESSAPTPASATPSRAPGRAEDEEEKTGSGLVRGRVVDRAGVGAAEATVVLRAWRRGQDDTFARVATDLAGRFEARVAAGRYGVWAEAEGFAPSEVQWLRLEPGAEKTVSPLLLTPPTALRGSVRLTSGEPLAGARITVGLRSGRDLEETTDAEGLFVIGGLREGLYTVSAAKDGCVSHTERNVPVTEEGGGEVLFELAPGGSLAGLLRKPDGAPLARGLVFAHRDDRRLGMTRSDEGGRYHLAELVPGPVELFARSEDHSLSVRSQTVVVPGQRVVEDLILGEGSRIEGVLRNAAGEALAEVLVLARAKSRSVVRRGKSDAAGRYVLEHLYPGDYTLTVGGARGGEGPRLRTTVTVGAGTVHRDLVVPEGAAVSGRVVDAQGEPVEGAKVFAIVGRMYRGQATSDSEGRFEFAGLTADDYQLFARVGDDRMVGQRAVLLHEGAAVADVEVVVRVPATLRGRVLDPQGNPLPGVVVTVRASDAPVWRQAKSGADGSFLIPTLYDGHYELLAEDGPLRLLAKKWGVSAVRLDPFAFVIAQGRNLEQDLRVRAQE